MTDPMFQMNTRFPTAARPLLGLTILIVEDSRLAGEALRQMCVRSGARLRRADCLTAADKHLAIYRPSAVIIDLGLPDGDGLQLIKTLTSAEPRIDVILGTSAEDSRRDGVMGVGADGFLPKPIDNLASFQELVLGCLPTERRPLGPRAINDASVVPTQLSLSEDLERAAQLLSGHPRGSKLDYLSQFIAGVARWSEDKPLLIASEALTIARMRQDDCSAQITALQSLLSERIAAGAPLQNRI